MNMFSLSRGKQVVNIWPGAIFVHNEYRSEADVSSAIFLQYTRQ